MGNRFLCRVLITAFALLLIAAGNATAQQVSDGQKQQLKAILGDLRSDMEPEHKAIRSLRDDLGNVYSKYSLDEKKARALIQKINAHQKNILNLHLNSQFRFRGVLSRGQFSQLAKRLKDHFGGGRRFGGMVEGFLGGEMACDVDIANDFPKLKQQSKTFAADRKRVMDDMQASVGSLIDCLSDYNASRADAEKLTGKVNDNQERISNLNLRWQQAIRRALSSDEFAQYRKMADDKKDDFRRKRKGFGRR